MLVFLIGFVILLVIGVPISISIGASAVLGCLSLGYPMVVIGQKMVSGIDSFLLIAIPLFIFAGNLMNAGSITEKIFNTARELVGWIPGGLGPREYHRVGHFRRHVRLGRGGRRRPRRHRDGGHEVQRL